MLIILILVGQTSLNRGIQNRPPKLFYVFGPESKSRKMFEIERRVSANLFVVFGIAKLLESSCYNAVSPSSVATPNPANNGHLKTGQRKDSEQPHC
jgi:hypothetical protein